VIYEGEATKVDFEGIIVKGQLSSDKLKILRFWIDEHKKELIENWNRLRDGKTIIKIKAWS
jgi:hypothetical protein